jgi:hypothetical protein
MRRALKFCSILKPQLRHIQVVPFFNSFVVYVFDFSMFLVSVKSKCSYHQKNQHQISFDFTSSRELTTPWYMMMSRHFGNLSLQPHQPPPAVNSNPVVTWIND